MDSHGAYGCWFRLLDRYLSRPTALAILAFTTLGAIETCIALDTHWLSVLIVARKWTSRTSTYNSVISLVNIASCCLGMRQSDGSGDQRSHFSCKFITLNTSLKQPGAIFYIQNEVSWASQIKIQWPRKSVLRNVLPQQKRERFYYKSVWLIAGNRYKLRNCSKQLSKRLAF